MAEVDKYIVDFDAVNSPDGTESLVIQLASGGENSTYRILLNTIKAFVRSGLGSMIYVDEPPDDGQPYVRINGQWVLLSDYLP